MNRLLLFIASVLFYTGVFGQCDASLSGQFISCNGQASVFTFTNSSSTTSTNVSYSINWGDGSPDSNITNNWINCSHLYQPGSYILTIIVNGLNGCADTNTYNVYIGSFPNGAVDIVSTNLNICSGDSIQFEFKNWVNNSAGTVYTIDYNDGTPNDTFYHPLASSFFWHQFDTNSCGNTFGSFTNAFGIDYKIYNPCNTIAGTRGPIYVSELPTADFSISATPICVNSASCFTNTSTGGANIAVQSGGGGVCSTAPAVWSINPAIGWNLPSGQTLGNTFGLSDPTTWLIGSNQICPTFTVPGQYTITLVTSVRRGECGIDSIIKTIDVINALSVDAGNGFTTCQDTSSFYLSGFSPLGGTWSGPNVTSSGEFKPLIAGNNILTYIYNNGNCLGSDTIVIQVNPTPTIISSAAQTICCGIQTVPVNWTSTGIVPITYNWNLSNVTTGMTGYPTSGIGALPSMIIVNNNSTLGGLTYVVAATDANGCISNQSIYTINVEPCINIIAPSNQIVCSGDTTNVVFLNSNIPNANISWTCVVPVGISGLTNVSGSNIIPALGLINSTNSPINVIFTVNAATFCSSIQPITSTITVNPTSTNTFNVNSPGPYILNGITYSQSGTYYQNYLNQYNCDSTIILNLNIITSLIQVDDKKDIRIYPNPSEGAFNIECSNCQGDLQVLLSDINGRVILYKLNAPNTIDISDFSNGVYILQVINKGIVSRFKVIKQ